MSIPNIKKILGILGSVVGSTKETNSAQADSKRVASEFESENPQKNVSFSGNDENDALTYLEETKEDLSNNPFNYADYEGIYDVSDEDEEEEEKEGILEEYKIALKQFAQSGGLIEDNLQNGTELVLNIQKANSNDDVYDILLNYCGSEKTAKKIHDYLMKNANSTLGLDYDAQNSVNNPYNRRNYEYLMNLLYTNIGDKFVLNPNLLNEFSEYEYTGNIDEEGNRETRPIHQFYTNFKGEICEIDYDYVEKEQSEYEQEYIKLTFRENEQERELKYYIKTDLNEKPVYCTIDLPNEDIEENEEQFLKRLSVEQNYTTDIQDGTLSREEIDERYQLLAQYDKNINLNLTTLMNEFASEGTIDNIRNWISETFNSGISNEDIKREVAAAVGYTQIFLDAKNENLEQAQELCEQELERRLNSSSNALEAYNNLKDYYGYDTALEIFQNFYSSEETGKNGLLEIDDNGKLYISRYEYTGYSNTARTPRLIKRELKDFDFSIGGKPTLGKIKELNIDSVNNYESSFEKIYSFLTSGGEFTDENLKEYQKTENDFTKYNTLIASANQLYEAKTPQEAFKIITGKDITDSNSIITDEDIKLFNDFYSIDKFIEVDYEDEERIYPRYFEEDIKDEEGNSVGATQGHYYTLGITVNEEKNGFDIIYQEYWHDGSGNYYPTGEPSNILPDCTTIKGLNIFQAQNADYEGLAYKWTNTDLNENVKKVQMTKLEEFYENNKENIDEYIDNYSKYAAYDSESRKYFAKKLGINENEITQEQIASYIKDNEDIRYSESCKYMQYAYTTSKQTLFGESKLDTMTNQYCMEMATYSSNISHTLSMGCMAASVLFPAAAPVLMAGAKVAGYLDNGLDLLNMWSNNQNELDDNYLDWSKSLGFEVLTKAGYRFFSNLAGDLSKASLEKLIEHGNKIGNALDGNAILQVAYRGTSEAIIETGICLPYTMLIKGIQGGEYSLTDELFENFIYDFMPYARGWQDVFINGTNIPVYEKGNGYFKNTISGDKIYIDDNGRPTEILDNSGNLKAQYEYLDKNGSYKVVETDQKGIKYTKIVTKTDDGSIIVTDENNNKLQETINTKKGSTTTYYDENQQPKFIQNADKKGRILSTEDKTTGTITEYKLSGSKSHVNANTNGKQIDITYKTFFGSTTAKLIIADEEYKYKVNKDGTITFETSGGLKLTTSESELIKNISSFDATDGDFEKYIALSTLNLNTTLSSNGENLVQIGKANVPTSKIAEITPETIKYIDSNGVEVEYDIKTGNVSYPNMAQDGNFGYITVKDLDGNDITYKVNSWQIEENGYRTPLYNNYEHFLNMKGYSLDEILSARNITEEEKAAIDGLYAKFEEMGEDYIKFIEQNPDVFQGMLSATAISEGKLISIYETLNENELKEIKSVYDMYKDGEIPNEVSNAILDRMQDSIPYELFDYIEGNKEIPPEGVTPKNCRTFSSEEIQKMANSVKALKAFLDTCLTSEDITLSRIDDIERLEGLEVDGYKITDLLNNPTEENIKKVLEYFNGGQAQNIVYNNLVGTSIGKEAAFTGNKIYFNINLPAGSKGLFLNGAIPEEERGMYNEREFLLQEGTEFKIEGATYENGKLIIDVTAITPKNTQNEQVDAPKLHSLANKLALALSSNNFTKNTIDEIFKALGISIKAITQDKEGNYITTSDLGEVSARAKGADSIFSKLLKKLTNGKIEMPQDVEEALKAIGDAQGVRLTTDNLDFQGERTNLSEKEIFDLQTAQNKAFVAALKQAILNDELHVSEVENYCGKDGVAYLTEFDVSSLGDAYKEWYKAKLKDVQEGRASDFVIENGVLKEVSSGKIYGEAMAVCKTKSKESGYLGVNICFTNSEGQSVELQYRGEEVSKIANIEHIVYDCKQGKETVSGEEYKTVREVANKIYEIKDDNAKDYAKYSNPELAQALDQYYSDIFNAAREIELGIRKEGNLPKIEEYETLTKELSDEELKIVSYEGVEKLYEEIEANAINERVLTKLKQVDTKGYISLDKEYSPAQLRIIEKIVNSENLYNSEEFMAYASNVIDNTDREKIADLKISMLDIIANNKESLADNESLSKLADKILIFPKQAPNMSDYQIDVLLKILGDKRLYSNFYIINNAEMIAKSAKTQEAAEVKAELLDKIINDEDLYYNEHFMVCRAPYLIMDTNNKEQKQVVEKILSDERLYNNENIMDYAKLFISKIETQSQQEVAEKILSDERLYNNKQFMISTYKIVDNAYTKEQAEYTIELIYKILNDEKLSNDENFMKYFRHIVEYAKTPEIAKLKIEFVDKLVNNEQLYNNEYIKEYSGILVMAVNTEAQAELAEKLMNDERIVNSEEYSKLLGHFKSLTEVETSDDVQKEYETIYEIIDFCIKQEAPVYSAINLASSRNMLVCASKDDYERILSQCEYLYDKLMKNPKLYVNGEYETQEAEQDAIDRFLTKHESGIFAMFSIFDKETMNNLMQMRFDKAEEYLKIFESLTPENLKLLQGMVSSNNIDDKPMMPTQKIEFMDLIKAYKDNNLDTSKMLEMVEEGRIDAAQLKIDLFNGILKNCGLTENELSQIPTEKLVMWDIEYAQMLSKEIRKSRDTALIDLIRAGNLDEFKRYIQDESNIYGATNAKTKAMFEEKGMDYDKWLNPSKENEVQFNTKDKNLEQLGQIATQIMEDIESLRQTAARGFVDKQFAKYIKNGEFVIPTEYTTSKAKLEEFTNSALKQLESVFKRAEGNVNNPSKAAVAQNTLTIKDHLNQRLSDIAAVSDSKSTKTLDLTIKMWDRVPQHDIFQGNYSTCCIGMGGANGSAMPHYLLDSAYNMIELVDNNTGKTIGNALCYFITDSDGKPAFVIDNIEIKNSDKPSDDVGIELRDAIVQYAYNVAIDVTGADDTKIYMSSHYNDVPSSDLKATKGQISFLGDTDCDEIYMDLYDGWVDKDKYTSEQELLELEVPKERTYAGVETVDIAKREKELAELNVDYIYMDKFYDLSEDRYQEAVSLLKQGIDDPQVLLVAKSEGEVHDELLKLASAFNKEELYNDIINAYQITRLTPEQFAKYKDARENGDNVQYAIKAARLDESKDQYSLYRKMRSLGSEAKDALELIKNYGEIEQQRFIQKLDEGYHPSEAKIIATFDEEQYKRFEEVYKSTHSSATAMIASKLEPDRYNIYRDLYADERTRECALVVSKLSSEQVERYKKLCIEDNLSAENAGYIAELDNDEYQRLIQISQKHGIKIENTLYFVDQDESVLDNQIELVKRGFPAESLSNLEDFSNEEYSRLKELLENGLGYGIAISVAKDKSKYSTILANLTDKPNKMRDFFNDESYLSKIKNATQGNYQAQLMKMLSPETISYSLKKQLLESDLSEQEFLDIIKKITKSTYKKAMNTPNQYLADIDTKYTNTVNGDYKTLLSIAEAENKGITQKWHAQITEFFEQNLGKMARALKYVDTDTINQMMDGRTTNFRRTLDDLCELNDNSFSLLGSLIKCQNEQTSKELTARDKIQLCQIVEIYQRAGLDTTNLLKMAQNGIVNLDSAKQEIQYALLRKVGITDEQLASIPKEKLKFNEEYSYLALTDGSIELLDIIKSEETISAMKEQIALYRAMDPQKLETTISQMEKMLNAPENRKLISKEMIQQNLDLIDMYRNIDQYTDEEIINKAFAITRFAINKIGNTDCINTVIREAVLGNFKEYIFDESNIYGQTNAKTKAAYEEAGLNYNQWLNPEIKDVELNVAGKQLTIKLWDRNPQEDLFIGNKTSCCTAIGTGSNAGSTPIYLLNTSFNVVELYDASGNAVAMSRVYMGKIDGQSVLLMDNYEINSAFAKDLTMEQKGEIRDGFFEYMNQYAQAITGNPNTQVYLYPEGDNSRFPAGDLTERKAITEFTGNVSQETVYINASGFQWINTDKMEDIGKIKWLIVPKLN